MKISIWIIITIIIAFFFLFYFKKNKFKLKKTIIDTKKKETKYTLTNIDKMLANVTQKEIVNKKFQDTSEKKEEIFEGKSEKTAKTNTPAKQKKQEFNLKSGIITSILLENKD